MKVLCVAFVLAGPHASAATYYVDYTNGADTNDGTAKTTGDGHGPWKHAPGMRGLTPSGSSTGDGCVSTCASYSPAAGDYIIMRGGTVWPYTTAPWIFSGSGSSSTQTYGCAGTGCIYIGSATGAGLASWNIGTVASIRLLHDLGGWNPSSAPTVTCSGGGGTGAAATPHVVPSSVTDPNITGFIYHITLTSGGSGYTSTPACTLSGSGNGATLQADIDSPIFDLGATQGSPPDWPWGQCSSYSTTCSPGLTISGNYVIVGDVEVRNVELQNTVAGGLSEEAMLSLNGNNDTALNDYVHGMVVDCAVAGSCSANGDVNQFAIYLNAPYGEVNGGVQENGDFVTVGSGGTNICGSGLICEWGAMGIQTPFFANEGPASVHGVSSFSNSWQLRFIGQDAAGSDPYINYSSDFWLTLDDVNTTAHINARYSQLTGTTTLYSWNNLVHNQVGGTSSQQSCTSGLTYYYFNEVIWTIGTGTDNYSIGNGGDAGGCTAHIYNDTMYNQNANVCVNDAAPGTIIMQNNQCITASLANSYWEAVHSTYENYAGSTTSANIQAASTVQSLSTANGQEYTAPNQWTPTANTNSTVTFASGSGTANLTSLCSGNLSALCSDINGNARPTSGGWQSGAYQFSSGSSVQPPTALSVAVQ